MATPKPTPSGKATAKPNTASIKKSGIAKLTALGKTTSEAHISAALRHGKITKQEAAAIDPKNFKILLNPKVTRTIEISLKPPKPPRGGGSGGTMGGGRIGPIK